MRVIITEPIAKNGIELLEQECEVECIWNIPREDLLKKIDQYDGMIVRSYTMVDDELLNKAHRLKVVGRAGNGIDNIDLDSATRRGVIVTNSPDGNSVAAAEHTIALILSQCRNIPRASSHMEAGGWKKKEFEGIELKGKTVGIIGLGRIGTLVAERLASFGCTLIAYDPYISSKRFEKAGVKSKEALSDLLKEADVITIHTPRTEETLGMIGKEEFELMKEGVRIVNCARGGIIQEKALKEAIESEKVASAGLDVFEEEPVRGHELCRLSQVVTTPHIGAATKEAQEALGLSIARQVLSAMKGEMVTHAVNLPTLPGRELEALRPHMQVAEQMGKLYFQLSPGRIEEVDVSFGGELSDKDTRMITISFLKGLLETILKERVNYVNAPFLAENMGIRVAENQDGDAGDYANLMRFRVRGKASESVLAGTVFGRTDGRIVELMGYKVDVSPSRYMLFVENRDQPGMIGAVGMVLGKNGINIASMQVGRQEVGSDALMILNVDNPMSGKEIEEIEDVKGIVDARFIKLS